MRTPSPGPISSTTSSGPSSASRPITPRMFGSRRKCWPYSSSAVLTEPKHSAAFRSICRSSSAGSSPASLRERGEGVDDVRRLVPLSTHGLRREVGRVGLGEDALRRDLRRREAEVDGLREGGVAGERDVPAALERGREHVRRGEAVEDDRSRVIGERGERVVVRRARVDHDRLPELGGELELGGEESPLVVARRVVAEPVEPGLADRDRLRMCEQLAQRCRGRPRSPCPRREGGCRGSRRRRRAARRAREPGGSRRCRADGEDPRDTRLVGTLGSPRRCPRAQVRCACVSITRARPRGLPRRRACGRAAAARAASDPAAARSAPRSRPSSRSRR